ncbi:type II toxin-antitoxin system Y4mF family antitoxin [Collinsella tanakaei]|uniref:type II toxin-antitoxin system Y4mF family antitoxin n=1 Tax=Collinsella tanakaei TaxID=626935 RepID=UPI001F318AC7|nr:type II toxin-antitoxin system Y4mF family antitoxin [Collinsella tanakaei]MCF2621193.1 helix-turn-helix transcriptional regulator [Collinsella tanakaei]MDM8301518.1 type II toxin-antitoxin system Y4mF family antitoxin [Collinsella tanakaei]
MRVTTMAELGVLIREERLRQKLTQIDLAGISGVGITFISQLENGKETAEMGRVIRVLTMLGIDLYAERRS